MGCGLLSGAVHALQIGHLPAPDRRGGLSPAAGAGEEGGVNEFTLPADHQPVGGGNRRLCPEPVRLGNSVRILPALAAMGIGADRRRIVTAVEIAPQGVGSAGHCLGLQGLVRKIHGHFRQQHPGQIGVKACTADDAVLQYRQEKGLVEALNLRRLQGFCPRGFRFGAACGKRCDGRRSGRAPGQQRHKGKNHKGGQGKSDCLFHFSSCFRKTIDE